MVFHLDWARGFPRKNCVFSISANIYFLPSQEQSVQTSLLTVYENLATYGKEQFTPRLCLVLLKLNRSYRFWIYIAQVTKRKIEPKVRHTWALLGYTV